MMTVEEKGVAGGGGVRDMTVERGVASGEEV